MKRMAQVALEGYPRISQVMQVYDSYTCLSQDITGPGYVSFENLSLHIPGYASLDISVTLIPSYPGISHFRKLVLGYPGISRLAQPVVFPDALQATVRHCQCGSLRLHFSNLKGHLEKRQAGQVGISRISQYKFSKMGCPRITWVKFDGHV